VISSTSQAVAWQNAYMPLAQGETGTRRRASRRPKGWLRWRVPLAVAALLVVPVLIEVTRSNPNAPYPSESNQSASAVEEPDLSLIREAVMRYQIAHLAPNDLSPAAASKLTGFCVGFGRSGGIDPSAAVMASLKDVALPIASYSACLKGGMAGRVPLWVVSVSSTGADAAQVVGRSVQHGYVYALERRQGVWVVTAAKLTGRSMARAL
jgi:hypothetical protein